MFLQAGAAGEEGGGVAVGAHAEQDQVEAGQLAGFQCEKLLQSFFVGVGCGCGVVGFVGHAVVAVGVGGGDVALVSPEEEHFVPGQGGAGVGGQQVEEAFGSGAAGEGEGEASAGGDGFGGGVDDFVGGGGEKFLRRGQDADFGGGGHGSKFLSPLRGSSKFLISDPTARAVGCILSPLCGLSFAAD